MKRSYSQMDDVSAVGGERPNPAAPHAFHSATPSASASNGDYTPKISRKIRACKLLLSYVLASASAMYPPAVDPVQSLRPLTRPLGKECQSRKVKCDLAEGNNTCARCRRLGLKCVINKSLQTLLDDENEWKRNMDLKYEQLHSAVSELLNQANLPALEAWSSETRSHSASPSMSKVIPQQSNPNTQPVSGPTPPQSEYLSPRGSKGPGLECTRENSPAPVARDEAEDESTPCAGPMASLFEVTKLRNIRSNVADRPDASRKNPMFSDLIAQGKISEAQADSLFRKFNTSLNHFLWGGVSLNHDSLQSVRESSSLLLTAILSVSALHLPGAEAVLEICYNEFLSLVSFSMFGRDQSLDDLRGLCIGAFYLSEVSWKLSGHAVRMATEMHLHTAFSKALSGSPEAIERARLWYLLYVCDHHFSLAYNRPPVIHEDESVVNSDKFLSLPGTTTADLRLHSQVDVFAILSRVFVKFGHDADRPLAETDMPALRQFGADLDMWLNKWEPKLDPNHYVQSYPGKGCLLHASFAKLQLNSLALRGLTRLPADDPRREFINMAIDNATTCLRLVLDEPDIRNSIVGVPLYLSTTITFATVFLMKVHSNWRSANLNTNFSVIVELVEGIIKLLSGAKASEHHVSLHTARGLAHMLKKFKEREARVMTHQNTPVQQHRNPSLQTNISNATTLVSPTQTGPNVWSDRWQQQGAPNDVAMSSWAGSSLDWFGIDDQYLPAGVFDAVQSSLPVVGWPMNSPPSSDSFTSTPRSMPVTTAAAVTGATPAPTNAASWAMSAAPYMNGMTAWTDDATCSSGIATPVQQHQRCAVPISATGTPANTWLADNPNQPAWVED
ncbi:hypothetical protein HDK90DRAFT_188239 [Phyllosticta capitalensis]|uniref:Xylanolytic transcriptional activator regulatory domain-containing protein n=1 Tax=Phyllosticta capitalensis TaxID=121624 RepID=A0ABR1YXJ6_9PEZI